MTRIYLSARISSLFIIHFDLLLHLVAIRSAHYLIFRFQILDDFQSATCKRFKNLCSRKCQVPCSHMFRLEFPCLSITRSVVVGAYISPALGMAFRFDLICPAPRPLAALTQFQTFHFMFLQVSLSLVLFIYFFLFFIFFIFILFRVKF